MRGGMRYVLGVFSAILTIKHWERAGNFDADRFAKLGVECHPNNAVDVLRVDKCETVIGHVAQ